jgi:hypothetical protein
MNCVEQCEGQIDMTKGVTVRIGCGSVDMVYPCNKCGRLHWNSGTGVNNRCGDKAFFKDGRLINRDTEGKEIISI